MSQMQAAGRSNAPTTAAELMGAGESAEVTQLRARMQQYEDWVSKVTTVCERAARGDLESRLCHVDLPDEPALSSMLGAVNDSLDVIDAYVRESRVALESASRGDFHRRFVLRGMNGSYRHAAEAINAASDAMRRQAGELEASQVRRQALASEFDGFLRNVVGSVSSAATMCNGSASRIEQANGDAMGQVSSVSDSTKQLASEIESVAAASEELTATASEIGRRSREASTVASTAADEAQRTTKVIGGLAELSRTIGGVLRLIH